MVRHYSKANTAWLTDAILEIDMTSYFSGGCSDLDEIQQPMQNNMHITANWSRSKPEVEFQYGGRLYFDTGSSYISAVIWDISTKFGLLIYFDFPKAVTSTDTKSEAVFSRRGRHFEKWIWRHISAVCALIWTKSGGLMQNNMQISDKWSKSKPKVDFQCGGRFSQKRK